MEDMTMRAWVVAFAFALCAVVTIWAQQSKRIVLYADEPHCATKQQAFLLTSRSHLANFPHSAKTVWFCVE